jgi:hypothetical protein
LFLVHKGIPVIRYHFRLLCNYFNAAARGTTRKA